MPPTLPPQNTSSTFSSTSSHLPSSNTTFYTDIEDHEDTGFSELETVAFACFLTLLPLIFGLISFFCLRHAWFRWRTVEPSDLGKGLDKETSERSKSCHALLNDCPMKTSESEFSVMPPDESEEAGNQTSKLAANGSIITMTMKNNHLIVETEERIEEGGGGGEKSTDKEVQLEEVLIAEDSTAIVHVNNVKPDNDFTGANTGLSTSDLSSSSEASTYRGYKYGTQEEYQEDEDFLNRQTTEMGFAGNKGIPRPSLDLGPPRAAGGLENPAFLPTPAEAS